jgi:Holliday junction resolvase RusA-like endonuclease
MSERYSLQFTLLELPMTLNEVMGAYWRKRSENFKKIHRLVHLHSVNKCPLSPIKKARITLTRFSSGTLDRDNMYFTFKPIVDGLVKAGVIEDDGFDQVKELYPHQVKIKRKEQSKVEVLVEEIE